MDNIIQLDIYLILKNKKHEYNHDPYFPKEYIKGDNLYYKLNAYCSNCERYLKMEEIYIITDDDEKIHYKLNKIYDFSKINGYYVFVFKQLKEDEIPYKI